MSPAAVCFGDHISLTHEATSRFLSSTNEQYASGSQQKKVFSSEDHLGEESTWIVLPPIETEEEKGNEVGFEDKFRLKHIPTRANLHSHVYTSPISGQQEVSCFGGDDESDDNDLWEVRPYDEDDEDDDDEDNEDKYLWHVGQSVIIRHVETNKNLHSHEISLSEGENEVTAHDGEDTDENNKWVASKHGSSE